MSRYKCGSSPELDFDMCGDPLHFAFCLLTESRAGTELVVRNHAGRHLSSNSISPGKSTFAFTTAMAEQNSGTAARNVRNAELQAMRLQAYGIGVNIPVYPDEAYAQFDKAEFLRKYPLSQAHGGVSAKTQPIPVRRRYRKLLNCVQM